MILRSGKMQKKVSITLVFATILASIYLIYLISSFNNILSENENPSGFLMILMALVKPHLYLTIIAVMLAWIAVFTRLPTFALISTLLYLLAAIMFLLYAIFLLPSIILGFIGYINQKKICRRG
jgi:hypothetical protein